MIHLVLPGPLKYWLSIQDSCQQLSYTGLSHTDSAPSCPLSSGRFLETRLWYLSPGHPQEDQGPLTGETWKSHTSERSNTGRNWIQIFSSLSIRRNLSSDLLSMPLFPPGHCREGVCLLQRCSSIPSVVMECLLCTLTFLFWSGLCHILY